MKQLFWYFMAHMINIAVSLLIGYTVVITIFPLAFESFTDGIYMTLIAGVLARMCTPQGAP